MTFYEKGAKNIESLTIKILKYDKALKSVLGGNMNKYEKKRLKERLEQIKENDWTVRLLIMEKKFKDALGKIERGVLPKTIDSLVMMSAKYKDFKTGVKTLEEFGVSPEAFKYFLSKYVNYLEKN